MIINPSDVRSLPAAAERALATNPQGLVAGWSITGRGAAYTGAAFELAGKPWVVVRGPQKTDTARLLDAAAAFRHAQGAAHALAILDRAEPATKHADAPAAFRRRFQAAAWHGLGIVWVESAGAGAWSWEAGEVSRRGDVEQLAEAAHPTLVGASCAERRPCAPLSRV